MESLLVAYTKISMIKTSNPIVSFHEKNKCWRKIKNKVKKKNCSILTFKEENNTIAMIDSILESENTTWALLTLGRYISSF